MNFQILKGRWFFSSEFSKHLFIDGEGRIIDPDVAGIPKPLNLQTPVQKNAAPQPVNTTVQTTPVQKAIAPAPVVQPQIAPAMPRIVAPAPIPAPVVQPQIAPAPVPSFVAPAPMPSFVAPAPVPNFVAPAPVPSYGAPAPMPSFVAPVPVPSFVAPAPMPSYGAPVPVPSFVTPAPVQRIVAPRTAPAPAPARTTVHRSSATRDTGHRASPSTRSASVSSSGSSQSHASRSSTTSSRKRTAPRQQFQTVWLNRAAILRKGPSLNTKFKGNLEKDTSIVIDTTSIVNIYYNDNLRKRIKIICPKEGWVTVETEKGRLFRKCQARLESNI